MSSTNEWSEARSLVEEIDRLTLPRRSKDLAGQRFGRLLVVRFVGRNKQGRGLWECRCGCGETFVAMHSSLTYGTTRSCGCLRRETFEHNKAAGRWSSPREKQKRSRRWDQSEKGKASRREYRKRWTLQQRERERLAKREWLKANSERARAAARAAAKRRGKEYNNLKRRMYRCGLGLRDLSPELRGAYLNFLRVRRALKEHRNER